MVNGLSCCQFVELDSENDRPGICIALIGTSCMRAPALHNVPSLIFIILGVVNQSASPWHRPCALIGWFLLKQSIFWPFFFLFRLIKEYLHLKLPPNIFVPSTHLAIVQRDLRSHDRTLQNFSQKRASGKWFFLKKKQLLEAFRKSASKKIVKS